MKKFAVGGVIFVCALIIGLLLRHQRNPPNDAMVSQKLPGTWVETGQDGVRKTITIDSSGYCVMLTGRGIRAEGTISIKDGVLTSTITNSSQPISLPFTESTHIIRMNDREMVLPGAKNTETVFKRVKSW